MVTNTQGGLFAAIMAACLVAIVAQIMAENSMAGDHSASHIKWTKRHNTKNMYAISSVEFDIGIMVNETDGSSESGAMPAPVETDELTDTEVEFLLHPAFLFNITNNNAAP
jgi:hypothetical protein